MALKPDEESTSLILSRAGMGALEDGLISIRSANCSDICEDMGLNALFRARMNHELECDDFHGSAIGIYRDRLEFICGRDNVRDCYSWQLAWYLEDRRVLDEITKAAGDAYSQVFTDYSGMMEIDEFLTATDCDRRVIVLDQSPSDAWFLKESVILRAMSGVAFAISDYDRCSRYNMHNLERLFGGLHERTAALPRDIEFSDAAKSGEIPDFVGSRLDKKSGSAEFIENLEKLAELIRVGADNPEQGYEKRFRSLKKRATG